MPHEQPTASAHPWWRLAKIAMLLYLVFLLLLSLTVTVIWLFYRSDLPSLSQLEHYEPSLITRIYSDDGQVLREFYKERRILVPLEKMPPYLLDALISTEDRKFYQHWGVDLHRLGGALWADLKTLRYAEGASTITQQLARMLFLSREKILTRKIKEWMTAIQIERRYSKDQILGMYLNHYYFGQGAYGVQAASETFFDKNVEQLTLGESALLIGLLGAPYRYDPLEHPELAIKRRNIVLRAMEDYGTITPQEAAAAIEEPLHLNPRSQQGGLAPYFVEEVRQYLEDTYGIHSLYQGGLSVFTTLDAHDQALAEEAIATRMEELQTTIDAKAAKKDERYLVPATTAAGRDTLVPREIQAALVAIEPRSGYVKAMVGGRNFQTTKFNHVTQAPRQPGSAFKPILYAAAIDNGWKTTDIIYDAPIVLPAIGQQEEWRPQNYDRTFRGPVTLREALAKSINLVAIKLLQRVSPAQVIYYAQRMGIHTPLEPVPSLAIGTSEVKLIELTSAYGALANLGIRHEPILIRQILDRDGNIIEDNAPFEEEVLSAPTAYVVTNMLQSVMDDPGGTGRGARLNGFVRPAAGKTGTTDEYTDAWFIGFTPQLVAGVWVGFSEGKIPIGKNQTGGRVALPIWTDFMLGVHRDLPVEDFTVPPGVIFRTICEETKLLATPNCPLTRREVFIEGTEPIEKCPLRQHGRNRQEGPEPDTEGHFF
jgi:penicillin-binding protein 1A